MQQIQSYIIASAGSAGSLAIIVNNLIDSEKLQPVGSITVTDDENGKIFLQPMVVYGEIKSSEEHLAMRIADSE